MAHDTAVASGQQERPRYTARQMRATHRGGGLYSAALSQRLGALIAAAAGNAGLHPSVLTMASLATGVLSGVLAAIGGVAGWWWLGVLALLGWQLAYAFDCADGQLARTAGQTSPHGARLDVLVDFAVQTALVAAVVTVAEHWSQPHPAVLGVFAVTWMVNLFTSALTTKDGGEGSSLLGSGSPAVQVVKLVRDYGAVALVIGLFVAFWPQGVIGLLWFFLALNTLFLLASIGRETVQSLRATGR